MSANFRRGLSLLSSHLISPEPEPEQAVVVAAPAIEIEYFVGGEKSAKRNSNKNNDTKARTGNLASLSGKHFYLFSQVGTRNGGPKNTRNRSRDLAVELRCNLFRRSHFSSFGLKMKNLKLA